MALTKIPAGLLDTTAHVDLLDDEKLRFGTSQEFQLYHTGSGNSVISETGSGSLYIDGTNIYLRKSTSSGEALADFVGDGAVTLYHNGNPKVATSSAGASVTGNLAVSGNLTVSGTMTEVDTANLNVTDKNITLNYHASNDTSSNADGAGITIQDAVDASNNATINWSAANDRFVMSHGLQVTSGNVGIGISPPNTFSVGASGTVTTRYTSTDTSSFSLLQFENSGSIVLSADHGDNASSSNIIFKSDGATEKMRINTTGHLTFNPVSAFSGINNSLLGSSNGYMYAMGGTAGLYLADNSALANAIGIRDAGYIDFSTGGSGEKMRIDSSGNVGIGATPSAHSSTYKALQIGSVGSIFSHASATDAGSTFFGSNIYNNSGWKYITTNEASFIQQKNGEFYFARAASGSAGATATLSYPFVIDSSGHVGIGTSSHNVHSGTGLVLHATAGGTGNTGSPRLRFTNTTTGQAATDGAELSLDGNTRNFYIENREGQSIIFYSGSERMRIDNAGDVGIGGNDPDARLHIKGTNSRTCIIERTAGSEAVNLAEMLTHQALTIKNKDSGGYLNFAGNAAASQIQAQSNSSTAEDIALNPYGGHVGIGTSSPDQPLDIMQSSSGYAQIRIGSNKTDNTNKTAGIVSTTYTNQSVSVFQMFNQNGSNAIYYGSADGAHRGIQQHYFYTNSNYNSTSGHKLRYLISGTGKHTFYGKHQGDSVGHFLFTNQVSGEDATNTNCTLAVQNGGTFIQIMGWTTLGARIGTRTGGWNSNSGGDVHFTRNDSMQIKLGSSGPVLSNGTAISSDQRLKKNITDIADGQLAKINALQVRTFEWKNKDAQYAGIQEGFIAQEVESVIPEAVKEEIMAPDPHDDTRDFEGDVKLLKHEVINARLVKAVQELSAKLDAAEARIATLEG